MKYRPEIDGLRALAVVPVILFHAGFEVFSSGFVGVDVFFVISGYLITTIISAELEQGKFSIISFYERRARRILPVLFLVMLVSVPFSWILLAPAELTSYSKSLVAVPLLVSNFFFWRDGGYFETAASLKPLLHTWSLALEEQYYFLFPLFLVVVWRLGKRWISGLLSLLFATSLSVAQWAAHANPSAVFFLLPTRGWELLIGTFAAYYLSGPNGKNIGKGLSEVGGCLGVALILYSVFGFRAATPILGFYALIPTGGALLVILFATQQTSVGKFIGHKAFVSVGLISYSAYLWHQPVFAFARYWRPNLGLMTMVPLIGLVIVLSIVSWLFVERPFRAKDRVSRTMVLVFALVGALVFGVFGSVTSRIDFQREDEMAKELSESSAIFASNINERLFVKARVKYEDGNPYAVIIGSSRIMQVGSNVAERDVLNLSVSGASIEDIVAIWRMVANKLKPSVVLLGADPWLFNSNSGQTRWTSLSAEYKSAIDDWGVKKDIVLEFPKVPSYFDETVVRFYNAINLADFKALDDSPSIADKIRRDGSRVYNVSYASKSVAEVERNVPVAISYGMANYIYSSEVRAILEKVINEVGESGREVVLVLSPYHPRVYESMRTNNREFLEIESNFRAIAKMSAVQIIGSYDPYRVGCSGDEFFDVMHPKDSCMVKVLSEMRR